MRAAFSSLYSIALAAISLLLLSLPATAHPDKVESHLVTHFVTGVHPIENGEWPDLTHQLKARVVGSPRLTGFGPIQGLLFNGFTDYLIIAPDLAVARPVLPIRDLTVVAWVLLNSTAPDGGIAGFVQDNGSRESGWVLGYNRSRFTFRLASKGADDGDGLLTSLESKTLVELERWYQVAGTYDGSTMRLYINGVLESESKVQSGDILYPAQGRYAIGAFLDDNESHLLDGALYEVKIYSRVMARKELAAAVTRNPALTQYRTPINTELQFVTRPYLQFVTSDGARILAETTAPAVMTVEYGERQPFVQKAVSTTAGLIQEVRLEGLKPIGRYFYRVTCIDAATNLARSGVNSFHTSTPANMPWAFGVIGDTQRNPDITRRCADAIYALRPDFLIHCGDVVDDGFAKHQWVQDLFEPMSRLLANAPMYPVIGNHEKNAHWYYDYFSLPAPEYYYTFTWGNAQFFMIDSNKDCGPGSEQYRWLEVALANSKATWKFTCHHHPCFSSDEDDYGDHLAGKPGSDYTWGDTNVRRLVPLYEKYGVDIAFAGHIHSYERTWPLLHMTVNQKKGVRYVVSGGGGGNLEQAAPQRAWFTVHVQRGFHYCYATAHDRTLEFKAYDFEGRLFDTFQFIKDPTDSR